MSTKRPATQSRTRLKPARRTLGASGGAACPAAALSPPGSRREAGRRVPHQLALLEGSRTRRSTLLIAPTGAGKTLAGFLPSLVRLSDGKRARQGRRTAHALHLAAEGAGRRRRPQPDCARSPRWGCRSAPRRAPATRRSAAAPAPAHAPARHPADDARAARPAAEPPRRAASVRRSRHDHPRRTARAGALQARRPAGARPGAAARAGARLMTIGLSATVARPTELRAYLVRADRCPSTRIDLADLVERRGRRQARHHASSRPESGVPWAGHTARYAMRKSMQAIEAHQLSLVFVNTRMQAELLFQELWRVNDDSLPIALHHGSLDAPAAPQGRGGDGGRRAQGRRRDLDARSRHRLGRRRSRHPRRRAEGRQPPHPAHRPRQSSPRRAVAGHARAGQPLRGAGMPRRAGSRRGRRAGCHAVAHRRARRAGPARPGHGLRGRLRPDALFAEVRLGLALCRA